MKIVDVRKSLKRHPSKAYRNRPLGAITDIVIHHSLTKTGSAEAYANYHVGTHDWPGIGYHYVIEQNGEIKWCNDLGVTSYHVGNSNGFTVGVCLTGDFRTQNPTQAQEDSLRWVCNDHLPTQLPMLKNIKGHDEYPGYTTKQCPEFDFRKVLKEVTTLDQKVSSWAQDAHKWVRKEEISDGVRPKDTVTREELWTMLYRNAGSPKV